MENNIELLKKLGFSEDYLKIISDDAKMNNQEMITIGHFVYEDLTVDTSEIIYPIIEKSGEPVNSYVN